LGHKEDDLFGKRVYDTVMNLDAFALSFDNPLVLEQGEVLGNGCLGKTETFPNMFNIAFLGAESCNNLQAYRVTEYFAYFCLVVETSILIEFHNWLHAVK
jgi:hypothetical protein